MADYWTHFHFVLPGTPEQSAWLGAVHGMARELIAGDGVGPEIPAASDVANEGRLHSVTKLVRLFAWLGEPGISISRYDPEVEGVWISSADGLGDANYAAALAQSYLGHIGSDAVIVFPWSLTCSSPRPDGFGGGTAMVTRDRVELFDIRCPGMHARHWR